MPRPDTIPGVNFILFAGGTAVVAQSNATLSPTRDVAEYVDKNVNAPARKGGDQSWTLSHEGVLVESDDSLILGNENASLELDDGTGSSTFLTLPSVTSITINMEQELNEVLPGLEQPTGYKYYDPLRTDFSVEFEAYYRDPANSTDWDQFHSVMDSGDETPAKVTAGPLTFSGDVVAESIEIEAGEDDTTMLTGTLQGSRGLSQTGTAPTTLGTILDAYFQQQAVMLALKNLESGSPVSGSTVWEGSAHISTATIELARNEFPSFSAEFQGDGALSRTTA